MRKLRFKNRNGVLYFGYGDKLISSKMKYNNFSKNIIKNRVENGELNEALKIGRNIEKVPLITDLLNEVMSEKSARLKHKSMLAYKSASTDKIIPYFQGMLVSEIKPIHIKRFQDYLVSRELGASSINLCRVLLLDIFDLAVLSEYININPVRMVKKPTLKKEVKKIKTFTLDEIDLMLSTLHGNIRNFIGISFFTGMRSGELLALKWEDVDFTTYTISISKTIADGIINSPKTISSNRDIEMIEKAKEFFKMQQLETGMKNSFVFLSKKNEYYNTNYHFYTAFKKVQRELNFKDIKTLHTTRHTFASIMLNNGIDAMWVSNTLGHENLQITLKIYAHFMPKREKMSIGFLNKRYKNGTE